MDLFAPRALAAILWQMFGPLLWVAALVVLVDLVLLALALRRGVRWGRPAMLAGAAGLAVAAVVLAALPGFTGARHADLAGTPDWLAWAAVGLGAGAAAALALLPPFALACRRRAEA